jgi:hypothetical protein
MTDWLAMSKDAITNLAKLDLVLIHMGRDQGGRPRIEKVFEASVEEDRLVLTPRKPA